MRDPASEVLDREQALDLSPVALEPGRGEIAALWLLRVGAVAIVLVAVLHREFELDRFFVPKEIVLHSVAGLAGLLALRAVRRVRLTWVDALLLLYLALGVASTIAAIDSDRAVRALMISVSAVVLFWSARALREVGLGRRLLAGAAFAGVVGVATSLVEAYGVESEIFATTRAPGGTLGNRNFIAHMAAFTLPVALLSAVRAWRAAGYLLGSAGVAVLVTTLVLTRSRAGWLAFASVVAVFAASMLLSGPLRRHGRTWRRLGGVGAMIAAGAAAAVLVPNTLEWRSENPYLETMAGIANYSEGSGRGRLVQYRTSLGIAIDEPLLGVGPGNWPEAYPEYAGPGDPSMARSNPNATANPWPSSDWVAFVSERGFPAAAVLLLAMLGIGLGAWRRIVAARDEDEAILATALLATLAAAIVAGLFDAVLLLAAPTFLVWLTLGALRSPKLPVEPNRGALQATLLGLLALVALGGAVRSVIQLVSMYVD